MNVMTIEPVNKVIESDGNIVCLQCAPSLMDAVDFFVDEWEKRLTAEQTNKARKHLYNTFVAIMEV